MSDTASSRPSNPSSEEVVRHGLPEGSSRSSSKASFPVDEDQPTVISNRPPERVPGENSEILGPISPVAPGTMFGHFRLEHYIGGGGMGRVYRALDTRLKRTVALKILSREQAGDRETLLRFRNEAKSAARLNHGGIAQIYFVGEEKGMPFIALEHVEGLNIRALVEEKGGLALTEAVSYTLQLAEALGHAHRHDVVHRDVKPSNVLVTRTGRVKLIDMGLARLSRVTDSESDLTASGVTLGTFDYISPEQARDPRLADVRSDIYSLGCTLFYMLAGRPPFPEGTVLQKLLQHQGDVPPDVREVRPDLPEEAAQVLRRMMAKDPRRRFRDPGKLITALHALADQIGLRPLGPGGTVWVAPETPRASRVERHLPWVAPVMALIGIVLLLDMLWTPPRPGLARSHANPPTPWENVPEPPNVIVSKEVNTPSGDEHPAPDPTSRVSVPPVEQTQNKSKQPEDAAEASVDGSSSPTTEADGGESGSTEAPANITERPQATDPLETLLGGRGVMEGLAPPKFDEKNTVAERNATQLTEDGRDQPDSASGVTVSSDSHNEAEAKTLAARVLVVDLKGESNATFATLASACSAAGQHDVVELRFNGRTTGLPFSLANRNLTLRAGEGYQPVVVFEPSESDPLIYPRSMISLTGGRLKLIALAIELHIPREVPAESWSLFEMGSGQRIELQQCSLTIRNALDGQRAFHPEVDFIRVKRGPEETGVLGLGPKSPTERIALVLRDSIVRGEAVFLRDKDLQPVMLDWQNGLLVTTERLLASAGGERIPRLGTSFDLSMDHVTMVARSGLCRLSRSEFAPFQLPAYFRCTGCLLVTAPGSPLIEQNGAVDLEEAVVQIAWQPDGNLFQGFNAFQSIRHFDPDVSPRVITVEEWRAIEEPLGPEVSELQKIPWASLPESNRPLHEHTPADYALAIPTTETPESGPPYPNDPPGFLEAALPPLPPEPDEPL